MLLFTFFQGKSMFKYLQIRKTHYGRLDAQKRFDPEDSYEQDPTIVAGAGGNDHMIKKTQ